MASIINAFKNLKIKNTRKKIRVQKGPIQSRVCGLTTTTSLGAGRYSTGSFLRVRGLVQKARSHSLSKNIKMNQQNAGKF